GSRSPEALASAHLDRTLQSWEELAGRGAKAVPAALLDMKQVGAWAAEQVDALSQLYAPMREIIDSDGLSALFDDIEMPLTAVLSRIERAGVRIDEKLLGQLSVEYEASLAGIEKEIFKLAGEEFKVSSPKQLQVILFEKLGLKPSKKTKTGYSTDESVLQELASEHELPGRVLAFRHLSKLKSTYVDALPRLVNERTGRIHPTLLQTGAATGRLSCLHPNLQNIPIRTEEGSRIRTAFIPAEGTRLLCADYSQVELRILAHYSEDKSLLDAFNNGEDVHRRTAAEVLGVDPEDVTSEDRAQAKAVNFGIVYGSSAFGLANQLGIPVYAAQEYIDSYFERYQGVRRFLDETLEEAKKKSYVVTLLDRRRYLPDLNSRNRVQRQAAERMAVNTVVQGTAADLIKKAMVAVDRRLADEGLSARVILQVHDELMLEVSEKDEEAVRKLLTDEMENVWELSVPLSIDIGVGENWRVAH
ncbi:MAG: DNA polymerase I, partial [Deltaproteobacteria bacterium]|nr:DNA polymerase I [Deltaproteobacteria bacterium]